MPDQLDRQRPVGRHPGERGNGGALGPGGTLSATFGYAGTTHLVFDVTGYFVP